MVAGGWGGYNEDFFSGVELFPYPSFSCSLSADLPEDRYDHSLSLLSEGRIVVCGGSDSEYGYDDKKMVGYDHGDNILDSCISRTANTSWTPLYTMRCLPIMPYNQL